MKGGMEGLMQLAVNGTGVLTFRSEYGARHRSRVMQSRGYQAAELYRNRVNLPHRTGLVLPVNGFELWVDFR